MTILLMLVVAWTSPTRAAPAEKPALGSEPGLRTTGGAKEVARLHYARGLELAGQSDYQAALREFTEAYRVSPHYAVLYNIGQADIALGRPQDAVESLSRYLREGQEQVPPARRLEVQGQIALLESLFAELTITTDQPGALITIDGREVGRTPLYQSVRLAAGTHKIAASMAGVAIFGRGYDPTAVRRVVTLAPGERQLLNLEMPAPIPATAKAPEREPPAPPLGVAGAPSREVPRSATSIIPQPSTLARDQQPEPVPTTRGRARSILGYSAAGAGAVLGGVALVVYLSNRGRYQDWQNQNAALQQDPGAIDYHTRQVANNQLADSLSGTNHLILGCSLAGGVLLAGGITLLIVDRVRAEKEERARAEALAGGFSLGWDWSGSRSRSVFWSAAW
jgi:tetratricopeptide (TPR) repeat protein